MLASPKKLNGFSCSSLNENYVWQEGKRFAHFFVSPWESMFDPPSRGAWTFMTLKKMAHNSIEAAKCAVKVITKVGISQL